MGLLFRRKRKVEAGASRQFLWLKEGRAAIEGAIICREESHREPDVLATGLDQCFQSGTARAINRRACFFLAPGNDVGLLAEAKSWAVDSFTPL